MAEVVGGVPPAPVEPPLLVGRRPVASRWPTLGLCIGFVFVAALACVLEARVLGKPITFDLGNYQYYSGFAELHGFRGSIALPGQWETYLDAQVNTIYYLLISHLSPHRVVESVALLQSLAVSLLAIIVWRGARAVSGPVVSAVAGLVAGAGGFLSPIFRIEIGQTSSDVLLSLLLFAAVAFLYRVVTASGGRAAFRDAVFGGILLGLASELKLTEAAYSVAIFLGFCVALILARSQTGLTYGRCLRLAVTVVAPAIVVAAVLYLPIGLMLWQRYQDPVFPFFNGLFHSRYLRPGDFSIGYNARTPANLWSHFSALLDSRRRNGIYSSAVESPILFIALVLVAAMLVVDLVKRDKPQAVFLELSFLLGFVLWAVALGFYRYVVPLEMAAAGTVVMLMVLHRLGHPAAIVILGCAVAFSPLYSKAPMLGARRPLGTSYLGLPPNTFGDLKGAGVVLAGGGPIGFLVPEFPTGTEVVRTGGQLEKVMSPAWWRHAAGIVQQSHTTWWVIFATSIQKPSLVIPPALRLLGFGGSYDSCHKIRNAISDVRVCRVTPASGLTAVKLADPTR